MILQSGLGKQRTDSFLRSFKSPSWLENWPVMKRAHFKWRKMLWNDVTTLPLLNNSSHICLNMKDLGQRQQRLSPWNAEWSDRCGRARRDVGNAQTSSAFHPSALHFLNLMCKSMTNVSDTTVKTGVTFTGVSPLAMSRHCIDNIQ